MKTGHLVLSVTLAALAALFSLPARPALGATFTVNSTADVVDASPGNGVCATAGGVCTLRAAIQESNALAGADTINVPAGTYTLTISGANEDANAKGDLDIASDLTINGAAADTTIIQACDSSGGPCTGIDRVFDIRSGTVTISAVTVLNGQIADVGGGIRLVSGTLTVTNSTVSGNVAIQGGGVNADAGTSLTLSNSTVSGNSASGNAGGVFSGNTLTVTNSTVSGNSAGASGEGGGVVNFGTATLTNSTVSGNSGPFGGGGIWNFATLTLTNSTVSGNSASNGGGIRNDAGATLKNTIVANSPSGGNCSGGIASLGHNLSSDGTCTFSGSGDLNNANPMLGPLAKNGGPTQTHALLTGSPAIDAGSSDCPPPPTDQRGAFRPIDGDSSGSAVCDIGAYEIGDDFDGDGFTDVAEAGTPLCGNGVNDDNFDDAVIDDGCPGGPPQAGAFSEAQFNIGTGSLDPCGNAGWPADLYSSGLSANKLTIQDITSFFAPVRILGTNPGDPNFSPRWDLMPGKGIFAKYINVQDITALIAGPTAYPPMLNGARAFGQTCPLPP